MELERLPKSYLGRVGATLAVFGVAVAFGMVALIVLFGMALAGVFGSISEMFFTLAALETFVVIALFGLYARSGSLR